MRQQQDLQALRNEVARLAARLAQLSDSVPGLSREVSNLRELYHDLHGLVSLGQAGGDIGRAEALCFELFRHLCGRDPQRESSVQDALLRDTPCQARRSLQVYVSLGEDLGPLAARLFELYGVESEREPISIGISGGRTIGRMMECVRGDYGEKLWLIPLSGSRLPQDIRISVNTIIGGFCSQPGRADVKAWQLPLDPRMRAEIDDDTYQRVFGAEVRSYYINDPNRKQGDPLAVHYAFTGIGSLDDSSALPRLRELRQLRMPQQAVGDMLDWPIDADGKVLADEPPDYPIRHHIVGVRPDELQEGRQRGQGNLKKVIVVGGAAGVKHTTKERAMLAAWRSGLFDILVTDIVTADRIVGLVPLESHGGNPRL